MAICAVPVASVAPVASRAETLTGPAHVIDGDTLKVSGQTVRLRSIDAPESGQSCGSIRCGDVATGHLAALTQGRTVTCSGAERDAYDRLLAYCRTGAVDLGKAMVLAGHAVVFRRYSDEYDAEERRARTAARGVWQDPGFEAPWDYRARRWSRQASAAPDPGCPIKGNISRSGERIYHAPWSRHYDRTRIDTARGERWFCTEADALAAGWRAPLS